MIGEPRLFGKHGELVLCHHRDRQLANENLWIHFHGSPTVAAANFKEAQLEGVLVVINFKGLSAAYSKPFRESPDLFTDLLKSTATLIGHQESDPWKRVTLSSFSAGYGAVREILKTPQHFDLIDAIVAADSMYASLEKGTDSRKPLLTHMQDYRRFAKLAATGERAFLISHTSQSTPYCSTTETADDLLDTLSLSRNPKTEIHGNELKIRSQTSRGKFAVYGYEGTTGDDHLQHLRQIHVWWRALEAMY